MIWLLCLFASGAFADDLVIEKITGNASEIQLVRTDGWKQVPAVGARVPQGTRVLTGSKGAVVARLPDGSSVFLGSGSEAAFHVLAPTQTELELDSGRARATVPRAASRTGTPRFRFKTKTATMGVRGTDFTVEVKGDQIDVHVLEGTVEVTRTGIVHPDFLLAPKQALAIGPKPAASDRPQAFEPAEFLRQWEGTASPSELHWWQRLWRWLVGLFA